MIIFLKKLFLDKPQDLIVLVLRYLNIWIIVGVPLALSLDHKLIMLLPLIGVGGIFFLLLGLIKPSFRLILSKYYYLSIILFLILCLISFILYLYSGINSYIISVSLLSLGFCTANCEIRCISSAAQNEEIIIRSKNLQIYNTLKVTGIAIGFFCGSLLSGGLISIVVSLGITSIMLILLMIYLKYSIKNNNFVNNEIGFSEFGLKKILCVFLFILDVSLFTFWYIYLPKQMSSIGFQGIEISIFLTLQAFTHAFSQNLWRRLVLKVGASIGFWLSFLSHIAIVIIIGNTAFDFYQYTLLFCLMGVLNSGTFLAASLMYYQDRRKSLGDSYIHLGASHFGKTLGIFIWQM